MTTKQASIDAEMMTREEVYTSLLPQVQFMLENESDLIANLANIAAVFKTTPTIPCFWVGFYLIKKGELVLGPFQGYPAHARIAYGEGVCGVAWKEEETQVVPNVHLFPGHIPCSCYSQSEIVVPIFHREKIVALLDIDSDRLAAYSEKDAEYLNKFAALIGEHWTEEYE